MISHIYSKDSTPKELAVAEVVKSVCKKYDIPAFTHAVAIEEGVVPHSHPILTLNTRLNDEKLLLKVLVHEQFHWYVQDHQRYSECISYLKSKYEDDGEHNKSGTYPNSYWEHIIVCFNTRNYLTGVLSSEDLDWVYEQWQAYPTLERLIIQDYQAIKIDLEKFGLVFVGAHLS